VGKGGGRGGGKRIRKKKKKKHKTKTCNNIKQEKLKTQRAKHKTTQEGKNKTSKSFFIHKI
jgi:hypothetical protein